MIQRIQSVWLLLAVITLIFLFFLPLATTNAGSTGCIVYTSANRQEIKSGTGTGYVADIEIAPLALNGIAALLCFAAIFSFRNRNIQKNIIIAGMLSIVVLIVLCALNGQQLPGGLKGRVLTAGTFLPLFTLVFCVLAIRGIRKDEQLLRSADRLR